MKVNPNGPGITPNVGTTTARPAEPANHPQPATVYPDLRPGRMLDVITKAGAQLADPKASKMAQRSVAQETAGMLPSEAKKRGEWLAYFGSLLPTDGATTACAPGSADACSKMLDGAF